MKLRGVIPILCSRSLEPSLHQSITAPNRSTLPVLGTILIHISLGTEVVLFSVVVCATLSTPFVLGSDVLMSTGSSLDFQHMTYRIEGAVPMYSGDISISLMLVETEILPPNSRNLRRVTTDHVVRSCDLHVEIGVVEPNRKLSESVYYLAQPLP